MGQEQFSWIPSWARLSTGAFLEVIDVLETPEGTELTLAYYSGRWQYLYCVRLVIKVTWRNLYPDP